MHASENASIEKWPARNKCMERDINGHLFYTSTDFNFFFNFKNVNKKIVKKERERERGITVNRSLNYWNKIKQIKKE